MPKQSNKQQKSGGNIAKNVSDLMVPFGLILAKDSLEKFLNNQAKKTSTAKKSSKKVSLSGGSGCSASAKTVEGYTRPSKTTYASVGGGGKRTNTQKSVPKNSSSKKYSKA
jgi:hypothetical protein